MYEAPQRRTQFRSFDGSVQLTTPHERPDRFRHLESIRDRRLIARGGGYAYSAASFGGGSCAIEMTAFNRLLAFDPEALTLKVEAGATLIDVFQWAMTKDLQIPVIPGYPLITIGGCIAADVHGKNPWRDGTFGDWVRAITIFHPDKGYLSATPDSGSELFDLTRGGYGLTGVIVDATVELTRLPGKEVELHYEPVGSLSAAAERLASCTDDFCYSWHDVASTKKFGRGLVITARSIQGGARDMEMRYRPLDASKRAALPFSLWRSFSARCVNGMYFQWRSRRTPQRGLNPLEAAFPLAKSSGYLVGFGRTGMREVQILVDGSRLGPFISTLEKLAARERPPLFMASLKRFRGSRNTLSQTGSGYLIALDLLPGAAALQFMAQLDGLMLDMAGQPNLSKDSRISCEVASRSISNYDAFANKLSRYDPSRRFCSELSERIGL
jgi:decaprenylphospho-beta-D-ribofuranose 2-oxidase